MACLAFRPMARFSLQSLAPTLRLTLLPSSAASVQSLSPSSFARSLIPALPQSLLDLLPPWLLAVPKSKTSHSKKSMRSSNKGLKEQQGEPR